MKGVLEFARYSENTLPVGDDGNHNLYDFNGWFLGFWLNTDDKRNSRDDIEIGISTALLAVRAKNRFYAFEKPTTTKTKNNGKDDRIGEEITSAYLCFPAAVFDI